MPRDMTGAPASRRTIGGAQRAPTLLSRSNRIADSGDHFRSRQALKSMPKAVSLRTDLQDRADQSGSADLATLLDASSSGRFGEEDVVGRDGSC